MASVAKALSAGLVVGTSAALIAQRRGKALALVRATRRNLSGALTKREPGERGEGGRGGELERLPKAELYRRAPEADVSGRSEMTKGQLIEALREFEHRSGP